jgi:hypothetical protein
MQFSGVRSQPIRFLPEIAPTFSPSMGPFFVTGDSGMKPLRYGQAFGDSVGNGFSNGER